MMTIKQAYQMLSEKLDTLGDGFKVDCCTETPDGWIFGWCHKDGTAVFLPPFFVSKETEEASFYDNPDFKFAALEGRLDRSYYRHIPLEELTN